MLSFKISTEDYTKLEPRIQAEYKRSGDGYVLDTVGEAPAVAGLNRQLIDAANQRAKLESQVTELTAKVETANKDAENTYKEKLDKVTAERDKLVEATVSAANREAIGAIANQFSTPELFEGSLRDRVRTSVNDKGELETAYFDKDGKPTTAEKLNEEYCKNPAYSGMLKKSENTPTTPQVNSVPQPQPQQHQQRLNGQVVTSAATPAVTVNPQTQLPTVDFGRATPAEIAAAAKAHIEAKQQG